jgi:hypothetical protein
MKSWIPLLTAVAGIALPGCFVGVDHDHQDDAVFTVEWSIDGATDGADCDYYGAAYADVTVESRYGTEDYAVVPCDRFQHDFYLAPGRYWVTVTMLDSHDDEVSTPVRTDSYDLFEGDSEYVVADFPPDSFR